MLVGPWLLVLVSVVFAACATGPSGARDASPRPAADSTNREQREFTTASWRWRDGARVATGDSAMVASNEPLASRVGVAVLRAGGNAVDAAVAVGFALAVTYPEAGNLGGGGFMLVRMADGRTAAFDYREMAPAAATRDLFSRPDARRDASRVGHLASGVPGSVAGMAMAHARFGRLPWRDVVAPALALARDGFVVDSAMQAALEGGRELICRFSGCSVFFPGGQVLMAGSRFIQPALAATLSRIADQGPAGFYSGPTAEAIAGEMRRGGGLITEADLAAYRAIERKPLEGTFRDRRVLAMPPVSSGGVALLEALNVLETWPALAPPGSPQGAHQLGAVLQRAYVDRNAHIGDPAFVSVPADVLTSKAYAKRVRAGIADDRATPTPPNALPLKDGPETTHYNVVDAAGNAVATTTTINDLFGSGVYVPEAGLFLNDEMDDFAGRPGQPNAYGLVQGDANAIAPGKRMLSSMTPVMVLGADGRPELLAGARGGALIISAVLQIVLNVVEHRMPLAQAIAAPRWHHQALPDTLRYEEGGASDATLDALRRMGWSLKPGGTGRATAIQRNPSGGWWGAVDPRREGLAIGW
jgi:gamma-glutamyltranspeptidase / glutathione hydrolase